MPAGTVGTAAAGVVFGFALAAPPGPMNAIIAEESVVGGWTAGFKAGLGAMTADITFFVLALAGVVTVLEQFPRLRGTMITIGGLLMLYFAVGAVQNTEQTLSGADPVATGRGFQKAFILALTNPYQILFWLTVGVGLLQPGEIDVLGYVPLTGGALDGVLVVQTGSVALLGGLFGGIVLWVILFPAALVGARQRVTAVTPLVAILSALVLTGFGIVFLWDGATTLL